MVTYRLILSAIRYVGVAGIAIVLVGRGHRWSFPVPALLLVGTSVATGGPWNSSWPIPTSSIVGIGTAWRSALSNYPFGSTLGGTAFDLVLVLAPAFLLAALTRRKPHSTQHEVLPSVVAFGGVAAALLAGLAIAGTAAGQGHTTFANLPNYLPLLAFGAMFGTPKGWREGALLVGLAILVQPLGWLPPQDAMLRLGHWNLAYALTLGAVALLGSVTQPLAGSVERILRLGPRRGSAVAAQ
jgi:hypothetical protein